MIKPLRRRAPCRTQQTLTTRYRAAPSRSRSSALFPSLRHTLRSLVDGVSVQLAHWSSDLVCTFANNAYASTFGKRAGDLVGCSLTDLATSEQIEIDRPYIAGVLGGNPQTFDRSTVKPDGSIETTRTVYHPDRDPKRVRGFFVEVTIHSTLTSSDSALAKSEARLVRAELGTKSGNWELHLASKQIIASEGACRIYGVDRNRFNLEAVQRMVLPSCRPMLDAALAALIAGRAPYDVEFNICSEDAGLIKDIHSVAVFDRKAGIVFGMIQDVTERNKSESALVESEARFRNLFERNGSIMLLVDPESGEINAANEAAERFYGYPLVDLVGMNISQINMLPQHEIDVELQRALREERSYFNFAHRLASGEVRDTEVYSTPVGVQGRQRLLSIVHDITARKKAEMALFESRSLLNATIDAVPEHICVLDKTGNIIVVNKAWRNFYDQNTDQPDHFDHTCGIGSNYLSVCDRAIGPDATNAHATAEGIRQVMGGDRDMFMLEYPCHGILDQRWFQLKVTRFHDGSGHVVVTHQNVTNFIQNQARLKLAASVFEHAREGIMITDADARIVQVNQTFSEITGYSRDEALGSRPNMLKSGHQNPDFYAEMWRHLVDKGHWSGELWNRRKNGELYPALQTISAVKDTNDKIQSYVGLFTDITAIKEHARQLEHIAHYDSLTDLPNRVLFSDRLEHGMAQARRRGLLLAVAYLDLDGFKSVNDQFGHDMGDKLLVEVARGMKGALREGDTLARIGGDEFAAVLIDLDSAQDCEPVLKRLLQAASKCVALDGYLLQVSASIGVTLFPQDGTDAEHLMRHADQAMYQAKQSGRNRFHFFDIAHHRSVQSRQETLQHIRDALDRREFVLQYQPKVNLRTRQVVGVEALIRWQHPEEGLLGPATFLPVIEGHSLSLDLGEWVIAQALSQLVDWQGAGLNLSVSVNIGAHQLQHDDFLTRLSALLSAHPKLPPGQFELEVLETSALDDVTKITRLMHACKKLGVSFALDDFGTGYSTLTYLKELPVEVLKIDQSFVRDMSVHADNVAIVNGVIGLAKAFGRQVIAEGVETDAHAHDLLQLGCELAQGYGIARPMPASDFPGWLADWRRTEEWNAAACGVRDMSGNWLPAE